MLNESKVKMMTKMAIYEKNEGKRMIKTAKFFKSDYVSMGVLKSLITTTIAYLLILVLFALSSAEDIVSMMNKIDITSAVLLLVMVYVLMLMVFAIISAFICSYQFDNTRAGLKRYYSRLTKLERFYNGMKKSR